MSKSACCLVVALFLWSLSTRVVAAADSDEELLWKAGSMGPVTFNHSQIAPEPPPDHAEVLQRFAAGDDPRLALFAQTVIAKEFVEARLVELAKEDEKVVARLPDDLARTRASNVLKSLTGREPTWRELLNEGDFIESVDLMRIQKLETQKFRIYRSLISVSLAEQRESHLRQMLKDRPLPDEARLYIEGNFGTVQISYAGKPSLTNVVVVTRAAMKAAETGNAPLVNLINETADPGADRNKVAAQYMEAANILHATPQAFVAYFPVLEAGDVLILPNFEVGFFGDIKESKVSFYCDSGALLDKVLMVAGPENDESLPAAERRARAKKPVDEKPVGPLFDSGIGGIEIQLKSEVGEGPFERCIPVGKSYLPLEAKDSVEAGKPLVVVAKSRDAYVALGPKKHTGTGLVLIPKKQVAKEINLIKKSPAKPPTPVRPPTPAKPKTPVRPAKLAR